MMSNTIDTSTTYTFASKVKDYFLLSKFTLSFTVVFTCVICYLLAPNIHGGWQMAIILFVAGLLVTASANAINQGVEKDTDALMRRTGKRPVAEGRMSDTEAFTFAWIAGGIGVFMMWHFFNFPSALLSAISLFIYAFVYTPLKKKSALAVLVGALPGALPCLIGWVAATGVINPFAKIPIGDFTILNAAGWALFGIQFFWQFPHFWAIAWVAHTDYTKAGFKLLPNEKGPTKYTALQAIMYAIMMVPVGILPFYLHISGTFSLWIIVAANIFIVIQCIRLYTGMQVKDARRVMFSSYIYLPIVYLSLLADKINYHF